MKNVWIKSVVVLIALTNPSCVLFKPKEESPVPTDIPKTYANYYDSVRSTAKKSNLFWWKSFNSRELDRLIQQALNDNFDIKTAWARLAQSKADLKILTAPLFPFFEVDAAVTYDSSSSKPSGNPKKVQVSVGPASSYELDLWGRVRAERKAGLFNYQANVYDLYASMTTVTATIADVWVSIVGVQEELAVLEKQIETDKILFENQLLRFNQAMSSGIDVLQQQEILVAAEAEKPLLEMQISGLHNQLALLIGSYPASLPKIKTKILPKPPKLPNIGIPSDLIIQRPDVRSAWNKLSAAKWNLGAAKANLLPSIKLGASYSSKSDINHIFSNWITNLSSSLTAPIFYGGKLKAEVEKNIAFVDEQVQNYGKIVTQAIGEVENAISNERCQNELVLQLSNQLNYASTAWTESLNGYLGGRDTFLRYITLLQDVQQLERRLVRERTNLLRYRIALYRALGGSWTTNDKEPLKVAPRP